MSQAHIPLRRGAPVHAMVLHQNHLLSAMRGPALDLLAPQLDLVELKPGQLVRGTPPKVYFPVTAMAALLHEAVDGSASQVALVGHEGMLGLPAVLGGGGPPLRCVVHSGGHAFSIDSAALVQAFASQPVVMRVVLAYAHSLMGQMAQAALCNRHHSIEQQLARWLLMASDRLGGHEIATTQEAIAQLLGVRREGVTEAARRLREAGAIACRRGAITVTDRPRLLARTCGCYAPLRREALPEVERRVVPAPAPAPLPVVAESEWVPPVLPGAIQVRPSLAEVPIASR